MRKALLTVWYGFENFMGSGWWLVIVLLGTLAVPFVFHQLGMRAPSEPSECIRYSSRVDSC